VVVVADPTKKNNLLIKRIIGLPGETMEIKDNSVYIGDKKLGDDKYGTFKKPSFERAVIIKNYGPTTIPQDQYFVLGDNRNETFDSRHFGLVTRDGILAKVLIIYGSIDVSQDTPSKREERTGLIIK
jgi:signal peptidase I